jgi:glycosyltransferase involved in cell wall biosynthesis
MGRFHRQKGFDLLLAAFSRLKDRYPEWSLTIFGDGPMRPQIESLRNELGLRDKVLLPGLVKNPHEVFRQADIFVLSSRSEGMPAALMEAMSCGLPVISTDLDRLMSDKSERERLSYNAVKVNERFALEKVMGMWEELLKEVAPASIGGG